jgi:hypothetical protein
MREGVPSTSRYRLRPLRRADWDEDESSEWEKQPMRLQHQMWFCGVGTSLTMKALISGGREKGIGQPKQPPSAMILPRGRLLGHWFRRCNYFRFLYPLAAGAFLFLGLGQLLLGHCVLQLASTLEKLVHADVAAGDEQSCSEH